MAFTFEYENNQYRVIRSLARGKTTILEFQISDRSDWRPLTEHTNRETQARIEKVLRLDYDTFINVSFFLQGRADQFAQQAPARRKEILGSILGLEIWEVYKERTAEKRKAAESALGAVDGHVAEIDAELAEEEPRKLRLAELETQLSGLVSSRKVQEAALASIKQVRAGLDKQRELVQQNGASPGTFTREPFGTPRPVLPDERPSASLMQTCWDVPVRSKQLILPGSRHARNWKNGMKLLLNFTSRKNASSVPG